VQGASRLATAQTAEPPNGLSDTAKRSGSGIVGTESWLATADRAATAFPTEVGYGEREKACKIVAAPQHAIAQFDRLGVKVEAVKDGYLLKWTESQARAYQLLHVLLHVQVVVAMRADFHERCAEHARFER
jgi:hypothetical protein